MEMKLLGDKQIFCVKRTIVIFTLKLYKKAVFKKRVKAIVQVIKASKAWSSNPGTTKKKFLNQNIPTYKTFMTCLMCLFKLTTKMVQLPSH
jgi:hypothetical protein